jgi:hypothetical protein
MLFSLSLYLIIYNRFSVYAFNSVYLSLRESIYCFFLISLNIYYGTSGIFLLSVFSSTIPHLHYNLKHSTPLSYSAIFLSFFMRSSTFPLRTTLYHTTYSAIFLSFCCSRSLRCWCALCYYLKLCRSAVFILFERYCFVVLRDACSRCLSALCFPFSFCSICLFYLLHYASFPISALCLPFLSSCATLFYYAFGLVFNSYISFSSFVPVVFRFIVQSSHDTHPQSIVFDLPSHFLVSFLLFVGLFSINSNYTTFPGLLVFDMRVQCPLERIITFLNSNSIPFRME